MLTGVLITRGMVTVDPDHFNVLRLTGDWREFISGDEPLELRIAAKKVKASRAKAAQVAADEDPLSEDDERFFEELRLWRKQKAEARAASPPKSSRTRPGSVTS